MVWIASGKKHAIAEIHGEIVSLLTAFCAMYSGETWMTSNYFPNDTHRNRIKIKRVKDAQFHN